MTSRIPINPSVLIWARETSGFSLSDVIKSKQFSNLEKWEKGEEDPTYSQIEKLAEKYHRPIAVFFFPSPPKETSIEKSLRSLSEEDLTSVSPVVRFLFRKAKAFQLSLKELFDGQHHLQRQKLAWMQVPDNAPLREVTKWIRAQIDISIDEQESWEDSNEALQNWRRVLAEHGIFVFKDAFKSDEVSGFCIYDDLFPVIYINNSHSKNRQIFTVFHEVAHLILKQSYLDIFDGDFWSLEETQPNHEEVKCNAFAAEFLVPSSDFRDQIVGLDTNNDKEIHRLSERYHVSREVILRRLLDQNLITQDSYSKRVRLWYSASNEHGKAKKTGGGNYYNTKASYLGDSYISLVFRNYYKGRIGLEQASQYLDIKPKSFAGIEEGFLKQGGGR